MKNRRITENFSLHELIESSLPAEAVRLNWENINQFSNNLLVWENLTAELQKIRNMVNTEFKQGNGGREIAIKLTSAFRCRDWELVRGRNGTSQHCVGAAVDLQPIHCPKRLAVDIMQWLNDKHAPRKKGWPGGFAISNPVYTQGGIIERIGFLHYDLRGFPARWEY